MELKQEVSLSGDVKPDLYELFTESTNMRTAFHQSPFLQEVEKCLSCQNIRCSCSPLNPKDETIFDDKHIAKKDFSNISGQAMEKKLLIFCTTCKQKITISEFKTHCKQHGKSVGPPQVETCSFQFQDHAAYITSKLGRNSDSQPSFAKYDSFKCAICENIYNNKGNYERHFTRLHPLVKPSEIFSYLTNYEAANWSARKHKSLQRRRDFVNRSLPSKEKQQTLRQGAIRCRICVQKFPNHPKYEIHWNNYHCNVDPAKMYGNPLQCDSCNQSFPSEMLLQRHRIYSHSAGPNSLESKPKMFEKNSIGCRKCELRISEATIYETHWMQNHSNIDPAEMYDNPKLCEICNRYFPNEKTLQRHRILIHHLDVPKLKPKICKKSSIGCRKCDLSFSEMTLYETHWKQYHSNVDPTEMYDSPKQCEICNRYFPNEKSVRTHRVHHLDWNKSKLLLRARKNAHRSSQTTRSTSITFGNGPNNLMSHIVHAHSIYPGTQAHCSVCQNVQCTCSHMTNEEDTNYLSSRSQNDQILPSTLCLSSSSNYIAQANDILTPLQPFKMYSLQPAAAPDLQHEDVNISDKKDRLMFELYSCVK